MQKQWSAVWIGNEHCPAVTAPIFQKKFTLEEEAKDSKIYISGLGAYVLEVNGKRVGDDILQPAFSNYDKTVYYNVYALDEYLVKGENTVEVTLGNVFYNEQQASCWHFETANWKSCPHLIAEIYVGEKMVAKTDQSWLCGESRTYFNSMRCGESYDATRKVEFTRPADVVPPLGGILKEQTILPIRVSEIIKPVKISTMSCFTGDPAQQITYDFGINISGNAEIKVRGKRGSKISLAYLERVSECLLPDNDALTGGMLDSVGKNHFQKEDYILSGEGEETWHSDFCYHGFRYIQLRGVFDEIEITARCFHTVLEKAGDIETDNKLIKDIHEACKRSARTNFHHMPTDCPHREKLGWTGDAGLSCEQVYFNFDPTHAYIKWLADFRDSMLPSGKLPGIVPSSSFGYVSNYGPCFDRTLFVVPWEMYRFTGKKEYLELNFEEMKKYVPFMRYYMNEGICKYGICDWLSVIDIGDITPKEAQDTILCGNVLDIYMKICDVLGEKEEKAKAQEFHDYIKSAYIKEFGKTELNTQTMYAMEIMMEFTEDINESARKLLKALENANYHITGGMFCTKFLLDALVKIGRFDIAYKVAMQEDYPGWGYNVKVNSGTLGENWAGGKSGNHHIFSEISAWYYKALAGIIIDEENPGFRHTFIRPNIPDNLKNFSAYHNTPYGRLSVSWNEKEVAVEIPEGTVATFEYKDTKKELSAGKYTFKR